MLYLPQPSDHNYRAEVTADTDAPTARDKARRIVIKMAKAAGVAEQAAVLTAPQFEG
jgi:hypothetical protein